MYGLVREVDRVLRGEVTRLENLKDGIISVRASSLTIMVIALGMIYGLCMGCFALFRLHGIPADQLRAEDVFMNIPLGDGRLIVPWQMIATTIKVPALFLLTLLITFPSLYVFNALVGSRLSVRNVVRLLVAALVVNLAVLASLGPIVVFFNVSTTSYPFMTLLNVVVFGLAGLLGLVFLLQTLHRYSVATALAIAKEGAPQSTGVPDLVPRETPAEDEQDDPSITAMPVVAQKVREPGALDRLPGHVLGKHTKLIFRIWVVVFGLVGAQMGWVLRPFIGDLLGLPM